MFSCLSNELNIASNITLTNVLGLTLTNVLRLHNRLKYVTSGSEGPWTLVRNVRFTYEWEEHQDLYPSLPSTSII